MSISAVYLTALLVGVIAGLRAFMPLAAVSWAASRGLLDVSGTPLAFLGSAAAPWVLTLLALLELVADQSPRTPSRRRPLQFGARILSGGASATAIALGTGAFAWDTAMVLGVLGAVVGTLLGHRFRAALVARYHRDRPAAFIEDGVAVAAALLVAGVLGARA